MERIIRVGLPTLKAWAYAFLGALGAAGLACGSASSGGSAGSSSSSGGGSGGSSGSSQVLQSCANTPCSQCAPVDCPCVGGKTASTCACASSTCADTSMCESFCQQEYGVSAVGGGNPDASPPGDDAGAGNDASSASCPSSALPADTCVADTIADDVQRCSMQSLDGGGFVAQFCGFSASGGGPINCGAYCGSDAPSTLGCIGSSNGCTFWCCSM
jgi:hypothetical protein